MLERQFQLIADEMGLAKTVQALVVAKAWQRAFNYPIIVIGPVSLRANWFREAAIVGVKIEYYSWAKIPQSPNRNYVLIADEAHAAMNMSSNRTKRFLALAESEFCKGCYPMTGTPMPNGRPMEMFALLRSIKSDIVADKKAYEKRYCAGGINDQGRWDNTGASHLSELHDRLKPYMLRRLKKHCLDLPGKMRTTLAAELSSKAKAIFNSELKTRQDDYFRRLSEAEAKRDEYNKLLLNREIEQEEYETLCGELLSAEGEQLVLLTHMRASGSIAKVEHAIRLAKEVLSNGNSVLLFTDFVPSAKLITEALKEYKVELLTGDVTGNDKATGLTKRQAMIDRFQAGDSRVFVSTFSAGGVGITLTKASDVILVDRPWKPGIAEQAEARLDRIGQTSTVNAIWLQCGKMDERVDKILLDKSKRIDLVMEGERSTMRGTGNLGRAFINDLFTSILSGNWDEEEGDDIVDLSPDDFSFDDEETEENA